MSAWNIQTGEVFGVLSGVSGHIGDEEGSQGLTSHLNSMETHLNEANSAANSDPIGVALSEFAEHYFDEVGGMVEKSASAVGGASDATLHYVNGNLQMAADAQANAGEIA
ncbi:MULTISPECIES: DUF6507 family protein [Nocardiopsidaceae]|uniref:DUF6507 family protein n=1 Tax=Streptomonospora nanhaiensis TaxID=1323731 RepID=A0ABY6YTR9_9ACTN|nr:DUF6507 family protein [Streptomonospora nanhaiensis]MEE2042074.1 DUF6507 family protein [Nocardiopsis tropica]WAE75523.1 DUF6507 family protein [Streptomonospora nanhaiensis]